MYGPDTVKAGAVRGIGRLADLKITEQKIAISMYTYKQDHRYPP